MSIFSRKPEAEDWDADDERRPNRFKEFARQPAVRWGGLALLVLIVVLAAWLGVRALGIKSDLEKARDSAQQVKDALLKGDGPAASNLADDAVSRAQSASNASHSFPWNVAAALPVLGSPFKTGQQISDVVVGLAGDVLKPATNAGVSISPTTLYTNGRVDVQALRKQQPELARIAESATRLNAQAAAISEPSYIGAMRTARTQLQDQTNEIARLLDNTALAAKVAPSMMGADGPRTYLMAFQTNAEARATGGLLGGFGIIRFDNGKPTVDNLVSNAELAGSTAAVDLGPEFNENYGWMNPFTDFRNSNMSSHFPYAAQIWKSMFERQENMKVDGVIALDPVALSYILGAVGPVKLADGEMVTAENVVELTESTAYQRFPTDQVARKKYLQDIANAVVKKTTGGVQSPRKLLDALGRATTERRISVWSASPEDQKILEQTPLAHVIPDDDAPYAEVIVTNIAGNKMDYYLKREIEVASDGCSGDTRNSTVTVRLTNTWRPDKPLPEYVAGAGGVSERLGIKIPDGGMFATIRLLATKGAKLHGVTVAGNRIQFTTEVERGHPSYEVQGIIPPGQTVELNFQLSEPTTPGALRVPVQPLVDNPTPVISVPEC